MGREVIQALEVKELRSNSTLPATAAWTTTNVVTTRTANANDAADPPATLLDVLCTLIEDLKSKGIIE